MQRVICKRSQNFELALSRSPYSIFPENPPQEGKNPKNLFLYCLPSSLTEYVGFSEETSLVRSTILKEPETIVAAFDPNQQQFVGGKGYHLFQGIVNGDAKVRSMLAVAALGALGNLDTLAAGHLRDDKDVVIVVGSGGREHALAVALAQSPRVAKVVCCPGNGGTAVEGGKISNAEGVHGKQDTETVVSLVERIGAAMVVVGPEAPLVAGLVDEMKVKCPNVRCFGPSQAAAELEASKVSRCIFTQCAPSSLSLSHTHTGLYQRFFASTQHSDGQVPNLYGPGQGNSICGIPGRERSSGGEGFRSGCRQGGLVAHHKGGDDCRREGNHVGEGFWGRR